VKPNTKEAFVHVETLHVKSSVFELGIKKMDTTHFFSSQDTWKDKDELLVWAPQQANMTGFTFVIKRSSIKNPMLELVYELGSDHKVPNN